MHPQIQQALDELSKSNYAGYFTAIEEVIPVDIHMQKRCEDFKGILIANKEPWNFSQILELFAVEIDKNLLVEEKRTPKTYLDDFKKLLVDLLDDRSSKNIEKVFQMLEESPYQYDSTSLKKLKKKFKNNSSGNLTLQLKFFIDDIKDGHIDRLLALRERYQVRLDKKMEYENNLKIDLQPKYTKVGTSKNYQKLISSNYPEGKAVGINDLYQEFSKKHGSLLIIGAPGSGKTVVLLNLAQKLIDKALREEGFPLPVLLNLAGWRDEGKNFDVWLKQNLVYAVGRSGTTKKVAKELVEKNNLLLLLDGLDEVAEDDRKPCIDSIRAFLNKNSKEKMTNYPEAIICSRKQEYLEMKTDPPVRAITEIIPLTIDEVIEKIEDIKQNKEISAASILLDKINKHKDYIKQNKLLTNIFEVYLALSLGDIFKNDFEAEQLRTQNLVDSYINEEVNKLNSDYPPQKTFRYLSFLATALSHTRKSITFNLIDIHGEWLKTKNYVLHLVIILLAFGLLTFGVNQVVNGLAAWAMTYVFRAYVSDKYALNKITVRSKKVFHTKRFLSAFLYWTFMFSCPLFWTFRLQEVRPYLNNLEGWRMFLVTLALYIVPLVYIFLIFFMFLYAFKPVDLPKIKRPYRTLSSDFLYDLTVVQTTLFVFSILHIYFYGNYSLDVVKIVSVFSIGVLITLFISPLFPHFIVRFFLYIEGDIPLRYVTFLNKVCGRDRGIKKGTLSTGLMEKDGGEWRFRHQLIQDRLSGKDI